MNKVELRCKMMNYDVAQILGIIEEADEIEFAYAKRAQQLLNNLLDIETTNFKKFCISNPLKACELILYVSKETPDMAFNLGRGRDLEIAGNAIKSLKLLEQRINNDSGLKSFTKNKFQNIVHEKHQLNLNQKINEFLLFIDDISKEIEESSQATRKKFQPANSEIESRLVTLSQLEVDYAVQISYAIKNITGAYNDEIVSELFEVYPLMSYGPLNYDNLPKYRNRKSMDTNKKDLS